MGMYLLAFILCLVGLVILLPIWPWPGQNVTPAGWVGWLLIAAGVMVQLFATSGTAVHW